MTDNSARAERHEANAAPDAGAGADIIYLPDERQRRKKATSGSNRRKRQHVERFRTDDAEHEALHERVRASSARSLGDYVMQLGNIAGGKVSRPRRRTQAAVNTVALTQAVVAFNRAGNNHNQIARALNELLLVAHEQSNARLASEVEALATAIRGLPLMFAEPVAAIMAALNHGDDDP